MFDICPKCDRGGGPCYHEYERMMNEAPGTAFFIYREDIGWQVLAWHPSKVEITEIKKTVIHDIKGRPSILRLTGNFIKKPIVKRLCKHPAKLVYSPHTGKPISTHTLLLRLPRSHPLRNMPLIQIGAYYKNKAAKVWREVKSTFDIAGHTYNQLSAVWTDNDVWKSTVCL
jgi:hypothetical protein